MTQRRWTTLAVLLSAALLLAGCGGGGGDGGVREDLEAQVEMLMAERDAAQAAQATAETARAAAEQARATADAARTAANEARATAETERDAALAAQMEAEAAEAEAVAAEAEAVAAQAEAEATQATAEAARDAAVAAKTAAEAARDEARNGETQAKIDLIAAQSAQSQAERERDRANAAKMQAEADQAAAETERDAANTAKQTAETARDAALAEKTQAEEALTAARTKAEQDVNAANAKATADLAALQGQLDAANENLKEAQDDLKEAQDDLDTANADLATLRKERDDAVRDLARAEGTLEGLRAQLTQAQQDAAAAEQRRREAEAEADRRIEQAETQADVSTRAPNLLAELVAVVAGTEQTGVTVTYAPSERSATFRPTTQATRGTAPSVPGSWNHRASFSSTVGVTATDTFYLYSNIESPTKRKFWQVYGLDEGLSGNLTMARITGGRSVRVVNTSGTPNSPDDDVVTYRGTFDGASGSFTCTGNDTGNCTLTNAATVAEGLTIGAGTWTFAPSSLSNRVGLDMQDDTYLYFGIWAREPKEASDTTNLDFQWIAGGSSDETADQITSDSFGDLEGTATFNGGAVGKYALKAVAGREARIGTFTAKATFTASFDENTLSGTIDEFKEEGNSLGAGWRISLINNATTTGATLNNAGASGEAHGSIGDVDAEGDWAATLHGSNNEILTPRADAIKTYPKSQYPAANLAGVAGWFSAFDGADAAGSNAAIAGAFGAACTSGAACGK